MTRTTIDLHPAVLRQLRESSQRSGRSMGTIVSEAVARASSDERPTTPTTRAWVARDLGMPVVRLEDRESVRAVIDRP